MRRYTVLISDAGGYTHYHVMADDRKGAKLVAVARHTENDDEDKRERRETEREWQPEAIFIFSGWCNPALK